jgi:hypothetical protein
MLQDSYNNQLDLVPRGYRPNPDWGRNFREDQDKITKLVNKFIDMELGDFIFQDNTMLSEVYFTKYWGWSNYCLIYKIKEEYNNVGILIGAILESTDSILKWCDLTTMINFNIFIITPERTLRFTYLDLLYEYITMGDGNGRYTSIRTIMDTHPRIQIMKEWACKYREYERVTKKIFFSNHPYSYNEKYGEIGEILQLRYDDVDSWKKEKREPRLQYIDGRLHMSIPMEEIAEIETSKIKKMLNKIKIKKMLNKIKIKW